MYKMVTTGDLHLRKSPGFGGYVLVAGLHELDSCLADCLQAVTYFFLPEHNAMGRPRLPRPLPEPPPQYLG